MRVLEPAGDVTLVTTQSTGGMSARTTRPLPALPIAAAQHGAYLPRPRKQDGNEPEILAPVLDELILELDETRTGKLSRGQEEESAAQPWPRRTCLWM